MTRKQISIEQKWRETLWELNESNDGTTPPVRPRPTASVESLPSPVTGMNRDTINQGIKELESGNTLQGERIRVPVVAENPWNTTNQA